MKQLKFMLAAATAVGLAAAAQADLQKTLLDNGSQDFEGFTEQTTFAELKTDGFSYPAADGDNESAVAAKENSDPDSVGNWVLDVNTGTNPVLRALSPVSESGVARDVEVESKKKVYIDAMVQFTVTPVGDVVTASAEDKLMIYLAESTNDVDKTRTFTNLVVKAGKAMSDPLTLEIADVEAADVVVSAEGLTVEANTWYNLKVEVTKADRYELPLFTIKINDKQLATQSDLGISDQTGTLFPSLMGLYNKQNNPNAMILKSVGFAGEGKVDNLAFYKDVEQQTSVDFTFTGENLSSVTYTIGEDTKEYTWTEGATVLDDADTITIKSIAFSDLYTVATDSEVKVGDTLTVNAAGMEFPITAKKLTGETGATVPENTKPAEIGIVNATIPATVTVANTTLDNMIKWASANNKGDKTTISFINDNMKFDDEGNPFVDEAAGTTNVAAQAFLLNCAVDQIETVKDAFKITALTFDENTGLPVLNVATAWKDAENSDVTFNGTSALEYKASLKSTDSWGAVPESMTEEQLKTGFFRARLILK